MPDKVKNTPTPNETREQTVVLAKAHNMLVRGGLVGKQTPATKHAQAEKKQAWADLSSVKTKMAVAGTLAQLSDQIGFEECTLDRSQLRGALLLIMDNAKIPEMIEKYDRRDAAFQVSKRRASSGYQAFVSAAQPGGEMSAAARALKLRYKAISGGFEGRADISDLATLGRDFACTVYLMINKERVQFVTDGAVDGDLIARLTTALHGALDPADELSLTAEKADQYRDGDTAKVNSGPALSTSVLARRTLGTPALRG